ncbi:MAG: class I SAM-dependent methyltransferase [Alphaproteobacteria bacterium]|nr:class I SAM-dependent methyltransferase [Alphaproteobacteria bacterium]MCB9696918.1 class I SAM-dependent methyltransferase [Alphaproteobacteria bacterium]
MLRANTELATASAMLAAVQSGLIEVLLQPGPHPDPAAESGLDAEAVQRVLDLLAAAGWVEGTEGGWTAAGWLASADEALVAPWSTLGHLFAHTAQFLRTGEIAPSAPRHYLPANVERLARMQASSTSVLAAALPVVHGRVLEVGAGSAVWGIALAGTDATLHVVDDAHVLPAARARAEAAGLGARFSATAGSLFDVDLAALASERVVCANVLHLFRPERAREAVRRLASAVLPGGDLVLVDALVDDPHGAADRAAYALQLRLRQPEGTVHRGPWLLDAVRDAGLVPEPIVVLPEPAGLGAIRATRR